MMPAVVPSFNRLETKKKEKNHSKFGELLTSALIVLLNYCLMVQGRSSVVRIVSHWKNFQNGGGFFSFTGTVSEVSALLNQKVFLLLASVALVFCCLSQDW